MHEVFSHYGTSLLSEASLGALVLGFGLTSGKVLIIMKIRMVFRASSWEGTTDYDLSSSIDD